MSERISHAIGIAGVIAVILFGVLMIAMEVRAQWDVPCPQGFSHHGVCVAIGR